MKYFPVLQHFLGVSGGCLFHVCCGQGGPTEPPDLWGAVGLGCRARSSLTCAQPNATYIRCPFVGAGEQRNCLGSKWALNTKHAAVPGQGINLCWVLWNLWLLQPPNQGTSSLWGGKWAFSTTLMPLWEESSAPFSSFQFAASPHSSFPFK